MDRGQVLPGSLDSRYEQLTGNEDKRMEWFIVRKELNYSIDDWEALPWWHQRVYIDGLIKQADADSGGSESDDGRTIESGIEDFDPFDDAFPGAKKKGFGGPRRD